MSNWWTGIDATGREIARISVPTLIADGTVDQLDPVANDHILARLIPGATGGRTDSTPKLRGSGAAGLDEQ